MSNSDYFPGSIYWLQCCILASSKMVIFQNLFFEEKENNKIKWNKHRPDAHFLLGKILLDQAQHRKWAFCLRRLVSDSWLGFLTGRRESRRFKQGLKAAASNRPLPIRTSPSDPSHSNLSLSSLTLVACPSF